MSSKLHIPCRSAKEYYVILSRFKKNVNIVAESFLDILLFIKHIQYKIRNIRDLNDVTDRST